MISAPSTCTRPPAPRPNAATRCSRPPSRRCAGSASAPGASARSPPPPLSSSIASTAGRHDHRPGPATTEKGSMDVNAPIALIGAGYRDRGGALLGAALVVLAPAAGVALLAGVGLSGAGAMIGHFRQHADQEDLAAI